MATLDVLTYGFALNTDQALSDIRPTPCFGWAAITS